MRVRAILCLTLMMAGACAPFPALENRVSADAARADFPQLVPLAPVLAAASSQAETTPPAAVDDRVAALQARAAALRGAVVDPATRSRMQDGIETAPLR